MSQEGKKKIVFGRKVRIGLFVATLSFLHVLLFVYPVVRLCAWFDLSYLVTAALIVPVILSQVISRWLLRNAKRPFHRAVRYCADFLLGISPIVLIILLILELFVFLGLVSTSLAAALVVSISFFVACIGIATALRPIVKRVSFKSNLLARPLRFVQISDVHIGSRSKSFLDQVLKKVEELEPEFLCITGDFIDATGVSEKELISLDFVNCPIYFSVGNHERYEDLDEILSRMQSVGVRTLRSQSLYHRQDVQLLGIDDSDSQRQVEQELVKMHVDERVFSVLMYHRPLGIEDAEAAGVDLMISGHTHNGQIFPFNMVVKLAFKRTAGLFTFGKSRLYVSEAVSYTHLTLPTILLV